MLCVSIIITITLVGVSIIIVIVRCQDDTEQDTSDMGPPVGPVHDGDDVSHHHEDRCDL